MKTTHKLTVIFFALLALYTIWRFHIWFERKGEEIRAVGEWEKISYPLEEI